ncbi:tyrosine-type recombinase/integrase [Chitinophaga sp. SYP-B3965]|uniref:site-specific integrase n=1 Tax=Chitinophaga sp. SYP-B3965 TaxID=2663120 RepID=UPI0012995D2F|nr:site-specific integrase [Chitinophaga sp. SYP-B3965]MRG48295.1 tyrosine-type recombinase/integrase [Chitinophaga sp. SYP-B3965]
MASVKIVLRQKQNKDNTYPLALRITRDRKTSFIHLGYHLQTADWDAERSRVKKSHPNSARLNNFILTKLAEANNSSLELETKKSATAHAVKQKIKPKGGASFFGQAKVYLDNLLKSGNYNCYNPDNSRLESFREFLGGDIEFTDITKPLLENYCAHLKATRNLSERSIINCMLVIRTVYNKAVDAKVTDKTNYPFGGKEGISIKFPNSLKIGGTPEEVMTIEKLDLSDVPHEDHARNVWLLSFYFAGIRAGDVLLLKRSDFQNDRLFYSMNKNDKADSLKIPEKARPIIERYKALNCKNGLLFPDLEVVADLNDQYVVQRKTSYAIQYLNKYLRRVAEKAKIDKPLTMHIARHTFGNISGKKIPLQVLQKLYRHADIRTTAIYQQNFIHEEADAALDAVLG